MVDKELMNRLVAVIEAGLRPRGEPNLYVVPGGVPPDVGLHELERESHCKMIRHLRRRLGYAGQLLIDQATFGVSGIEQLSDDVLVQLHRDMERAMECVQEGISFEDAGLIKSRFG